MADVIVVAGAQFGSEAKGAVVAGLAAAMTETDVVIRVAGPNAGHTAYDKQGREWKLRAIPVGAVASPTVGLHIAAGSEVDLEVLEAEIRTLENAGHKVRHRLTIDPSATILSPRHRSEEAVWGGVGRIGSTGKGIGAARAARIMRTAETFGNLTAHGYRELAGSLELLGSYDRIVVEGTQGYGLGLHTPFYPQVTSSDCRAIDFLAMAGISPWDDDIENFRVILVARTFPIRVAGNSGPLKGETTWADLGLPEERTTVTNKVRRVGEWDLGLVRSAIEANGGGNWNSRVTLAVTMLDQMFPAAKRAANWNDLPEEARLWLTEVQDELETEIVLVGTSPHTHFAVEIN